MAYKINKGFIVQKLDGKITIFDGEESALYTLNETASFIFEKLKKNWDTTQIVESLVKIYKIKEKKAKTDVKDLLTELKRRKIILPYA